MENLEKLIVQEFGPYAAEILARIYCGESSACVTRLGEDKQHLKPKAESRRRTASALMVKTKMESRIVC